MHNHTWNDLLLGTRVWPSSAQLVIIFIESKTAYQFYEYITQGRDVFQVQRPGPDEKQLIEQRQEGAPRA